MIQFRYILQNNHSAATKQNSPFREEVLQSVLEKKRHQSLLHILGEDVQNETRCYSRAAGRTQSKNMTVKLNFCKEKQEVGRTKCMTARNSESKEVTQKG